MDFFESKSNQWLRSSNADARQDAWGYVTRDFTGMVEFLREQAFGKSTGSIELYRSGAIGGGLSYFFQNKASAQAYGRRTGEKEVTKIKARIEEIVPSGSASGEVWAEV